jgi:hypothetical protein
MRERTKDAFRPNLISKGTIIVSMPNGFIPQGPRDGEASMIHRSGWRVKDFKARGFIVHGIGCRFYPLIRAKNMVLWSLIFYFFTPLSYLIPQLAEIIICVKRKARVIGHE